MRFPDDVHMAAMPLYSPEEHQSEPSDGWVYHWGIVLFTVTDFTGGCIHVWCLSDEAPQWIKDNLVPQIEGGSPIQSHLPDGQ